MDFQLLANADIYREVVRARMLTAGRSLWISSANLKDMHVEGRRPSSRWDSPLVPTRLRVSERGSRREGFRSVLKALGEMAGRGVDVRVLHAAVPSERYLHSLKEEGLIRRAHFTMRRCPRVHMKCVLVDGEWCFVGSPNLTGAGMGAKADNRRNFEVGVLTRDATLRRGIETLFLDVWEGRACKGCGRKRSCPVPLEEPDF